MDPRPLHWASGEDGFTIVEVLVAATLLIIGVLSTLSILDTGVKSTAVTKQRDVANSLAQEMVERSVGGRYTAVRNDMTDIDAAVASPGPADRLRAGIDPDGDQSSGVVTPATVTSGIAPVFTAQSWAVTRKNTRYTVSYRACTASDTYQQVSIAGPYDCDRATTNPGGGNQATSGACSVGVIPATQANPADPGTLTVRLQLLNAVGLSACVGALAPGLSNPLSDAVCSLLGSSALLDSLKGSLLGTNGLLPTLLGGLAGGSVGLCPLTQVDTALAGAANSIGTSTRVAVTVAWRDLRGREISIEQSALVRRPAV